MSKGQSKNEKMDNVMEIKPEQQKQTKSVKEVLAEDAIMIKGMTYTHDEAKKFMPIFAKIENDMLDCVAAIDREEKKNQEAEKNAETDPE